MKIQDFNTFEMTRTSEQHFGNGKIKQITNLKSENTAQTASVQKSGKSDSFQSYILDALNSVNSQQVNVTSVQEKLITNPDEVDVHDVTIAMAKARQSLNLAQTVIDRIVTGWNEITTTR